MRHIAITAAILFLSSFIPEEEITISSTHALVSKNLVLRFEIQCNEGANSICRFPTVSSGLSPNEYCDIILYDKEMNAIRYLMFKCSLSSASIKEMHVKFYQNNPVKFVCEVDTSRLEYANPYLSPNGKVLLKNILFYKMVYHAPIGRPKRSVGDLESPLFSLQ